MGYIEPGVPSSKGIQLDELEKSLLFHTNEKPLLIENLTGMEEGRMVNSV